MKLTFGPMSYIYKKGSFLDLPEDPQPAKTRRITRGVRSATAPSRSATEEELFCDCEGY